MRGSAAAPTVMPMEHGSLISRLRRLDPQTLDWAIVVALVVWAQLDLWLLGETLTAVRGSHGLAAPFLVLFALPLGWRRRRPLTALCAVMGAIALEAVVLGAPVQGVDLMLPMLIALYSVAAYAELRPALIGFGVGFVGMLVAMLLEPEVVTFGDLIVIQGTFFVALGGSAWLLGEFVRARRLVTARFEDCARRGSSASRSSGARAAAAAERARIARELHDVIAHTRQRDGRPGRGRAPTCSSATRRGERARCDSIEDTGREALGRDAPAARAAAHRRASSDARAAAGARAARRAGRAGARAPGLPVELEVEGEPATLPPGVDLVGLPDRPGGADQRAQARGPARRVAVRVRRRRDAVELEVRDDGRGAGPGDERRRPRAGRACASASRSYGGTLDAGPAPTAASACARALPLTPSAA